MPEEVLARLKNLRMTGDDVEVYIATFENLMRQAGCERGGIWMVKYFRQALPADFKMSILDQETIPDALDEWQLAARKEAKRHRLTNAHGPGHKGDTDTAQSGVIRLPRAWLMKEGRCFECYRKGRLAQDCPDNFKGENVGN